MVEPNQDFYPMIGLTDAAEHFWKAMRRGAFQKALQKLAGDPAKSAATKIFWVFWC